MVDVRKYCWHDILGSMDVGFTPMMGVAEGYYDVGGVNDRLELRNSQLDCPMGI